VVAALFATLTPRFSRGGARVRLGPNTAHFPDAMAELEGFARPLWGVAPLAAGGGRVGSWPLLRAGLDHGTDPGHPEYWGPVGDFGHALVEMPPLALALALVPHRLWRPLPPTARRNVVRWLVQINKCRLHENNWQFFRVLVNQGLAGVGQAVDPRAMRQAFDVIDGLYKGDGWYSDGSEPRHDYYVAFAFHFYGLVYARLAGRSDPRRAAVYRDRAVSFARNYQHWFAAGGEAVAWGRSLTYRFAQAAFWGALAFAGLEALPWGRVKALALGNLRWWLRQPIFTEGGALAVGYGYENTNVGEEYTAPASPYWAFKAFLPLALAASHPFWTAAEDPPRGGPTVQEQRTPGLLVCADQQRRHVFFLSTGQAYPALRYGGAKYGKFAYSSYFGFCVPAGEPRAVRGAFDSALALSDDGLDYRSRVECREHALERGVLYSRWMPWPDVEVSTWLIPALPWHLRVHRVATKRRLWSTEGAFSLRPDEGRQNNVTSRGGAFVATRWAWTGIYGLWGQRRPRIVGPISNANILHPRVVLPVLEGDLRRGVTWLVCGVIGRLGRRRLPWPPPAPARVRRTRTGVAVATSDIEYVLGC
jgi:hypothetical protein